MTTPDPNCFNRHRQNHSHAEARGVSRAAMVRLQHTHTERERDARMEGGTAEEEASGRKQAVRSTEANQLKGKL